MLDTGLIVTPALTALIDKYDGRAPRYTSYPTAVQFTPDVDADTYRRWLGAMTPGERVSLYVHVPFCTRLCWYCGCHTRVANTHHTIGEYVQFLLAELALLKSALPERPAATAIAFGGGTPNTLWPDEVDTLFAALRGAFDFAEDAEISAELDPAALTRDWVERAARNGLNRASIGVQTLAGDVQRAVNRTESFEDIATCVGWLRRAGIGSINLDLMYGLPHQTTANTLATVESILRLRPERLALFGYAHVPWVKANQKLIDEAALPGAAARLEQSEAAADLLQREGYIRIGLDHFALPGDQLAVALEQGRLHRNFQGYTTDEAQTLIGIGASAIGAFRQGYVQNIAQEAPWRAAIAAGRLPIARGAVRTGDDLFRGEIIERLMCDLEVDLADVCARHGRSLSELAPERARLAAFAKDGLVDLSYAYITLTPAGRLLMRPVCAVFDAYLDRDAGRHSKVI